MQLKTLSLLADPTRLRILAITRRQELAVSEIQEVLRLGQSRISTHLSQLKAGGLLEDRREGQRSYYRWPADLSQDLQTGLELAMKAAAGLPTHRQDCEALEIVLQKRRAASERYFNLIAGRLGKNYCPGRSWEAVGHLMLQMIPALVIADLGAGEGLIAQLLASRAKKVIAVDLSERMVEVGRELAQRNGLTNLEYRQGDLQAPPIRAHSVDVALLSQSLHHATDPARAVEAAARLLKPGGRLLILDLHAHSFEKARELYGDLWLGFDTIQLHQWLERAGLRHVRVDLVFREETPPHFQTLLATGQSP